MRYDHLIPANVPESFFTNLKGSQQTARLLAKASRKRSARRVLINFAVIVAGIALTTAMALYAPISRGADASTGSTVTTTTTVPATKSGRTIGETTDDVVVTARVKAALIGDQVTKARDIKVNTYHGTVQLSGFADNQTEIDRAIALASKTEGVASVKNSIELKK